MEYVVFPDTADKLRPYVKNGLQEILGAFLGEVYADSLPSTLPHRSVLIQRTGGFQREWTIDEVQLTLEARSTASVEEAWKAISAARALILALERSGGTGDVTVYEVNEQVGPYWDPDPINPLHHRFSATFRLAVKGSVIPAGQNA